LQVNQNYGLENMLQNKKRPSQKVFNNKTPMCFNKYQPTLRETYNEFYIIFFICCGTVDLFVAKIAGYTFL